MKVVAGDPNLLEVVLAAHPVGCLPYFLDSGKQQADQHADDGDHDQQLDQREAGADS